MLKVKIMIYIGVGMGPLTVVLMDILFVGADTSNELVNSFRNSGTTPFTAWVVALFMGHWFHPVDSLKPGFGKIGAPWNYIIFGTLTVLVGLLCYLIIDTSKVSDWFPMLMVLLGFATGVIFWPVGLRPELRH